MPCVPAIRLRRDKQRAGSELSSASRSVVVLLFGDTPFGPLLWCDPCVTLYERPVVTRRRWFP